MSAPISKTLAVSVVTIVLNAKHGFQKTLNSVLQNDFQCFQYVVIDGGSTDGTLDVIRENEGKINYWISEPDNGISHAFNKGIKQANGDIIGILNVGDWYEADTLKNVVDAFSSHPNVDVVCGALEFWEEGLARLHCDSNPEALDKETSVYHPTVFVRKSSYMKYGFFDEGYRYAMDYELLLRFKKQGAKFLTIEKTLANMSLDGISYHNWYKALKEVRIARSKYFPYYDVAYYHLLAILKNLIARALKKSGLRRLYQAYWQSKNQRIRNEM
ncbi:MAG: glycosyltransferase family 2 protein [Bacteroidota bacterium]